MWIRQDVHPCGLADSEIRTSVAPDSEIRHSRTAGVFWDKAGKIVEI